MVDEEFIVYTTADDAGENTERIVPLDVLLVNIQYGPNYAINVAPGLNIEELDEDRIIALGEALKVSLRNFRDSGITEQIQ